MKNILKILAVVGTGMAIGTLAGKFLHSEKVRNIRYARVKSNDELDMSTEYADYKSSNKEELENYFI